MTIDPAIADALCIVGIVGALGAVAIVLREKLRPELSSDWSERDFGDQPDVSNLSHFGTFTPKGE